MFYPFGCWIIIVVVVVVFTGTRSCSAHKVLILFAQPAKQPFIPYLLLFSPPIRSRTIIESKCAVRGDVSNDPQAQDVEDGISCAGSATVRAPLRVCVVVKLLCLLHLLV